MAVTSINKGDPSIANRYLADQLTQGEREAFEARLLQDPSALRELEATARFKRGLQKLRESGKLEGVVAERAFGERWSKLAARAMRDLESLGARVWPSTRVTDATADGVTVGSERIASAWPSLAAAVAILVLGFAFLSWNNSAAPMMASTVSSLVDHGGHPLSIAATYAVFRKRGAAHDAVITLPTSQRAIELRVQPDLGAEPPYRMSLTLPQTSPGVQPLSSVANLRPGPDGFISVFIDSSQLAPGDYIIFVSGAATEPDRRSAFLIRFTAGD